MSYLKGYIQWNRKTVPILRLNMKEVSAKSMHVQVNIWEDVYLYYVEVQLSTFKYVEDQTFV